MTTKPLRICSLRNPLSSFISPNSNHHLRLLEYALLTARPLLATSISTLISEAKSSQFIADNTNLPSSFSNRNAFPSDYRLPPNAYEQMLPSELLGNNVVVPAFLHSTQFHPTQQTQDDKMSQTWEDFSTPFSQYLQVESGIPDDFFMQPNNSGIPSEMPFTSNPFNSPDDLLQALFEIQAPESTVDLSLIPPPTQTSSIKRSWLTCLALANVKETSHKIDKQRK